MRDNASFFYVFPAQSHDLFGKTKGKRSISPARTQKTIKTNRATGRFQATLETRE